MLLDNKSHIFYSKVEKAQLWMQWFYAWVAKQHVQVDKRARRHSSRPTASNFQIKIVSFSYISTFYIKPGILLSKAFLSVTLNNDGVDTYKPSVYGSKIIIERRIMKDGQSQYKIMNENCKLRTF